jgi:DNA-binding NarL/FixJ family response regulator
MEAPKMPDPRVLDRARQLWRLTPRECEVLDLVAQGLSNKEIAEVIKCAPRTVEHRVASLLVKARESNRMRLAIRLWQWID